MLASVRTPLRPKVDYMTYKKYLRNLFSRKQLDNIYATIDVSFDLSFVDAYQNVRSHKDTPLYYSLKTLLEALDNSENLFRQFPLDERSIKMIARSIFIEDAWLMRDPELAMVDGVLYIIGGRHRLTAIVSTLAQLANHLGTDENSKEELFGNYIDQNIRVEVTHINDAHDLLKLVMASNQSRIMRKAEHSHLRVQQLGANATSSHSAAQAVLTSELTPKEAKELAAQVFVRKHSEKLKPQTKQTLGEKVASFVLYGVKPGEKLTRGKPVLIRSISEFEDAMDKAWGIVTDITSNELVVARNATSIATEVIDRLEQSDTVIDEVEEQETTPHIEADGLTFPENAVEVESVPTEEEEPPKANKRTGRASKKKVELTDDDF